MLPVPSIAVICLRHGPPGVYEDHIVCIRRVFIQNLKRVHRIHCRATAAVISNHGVVFDNVVQGLAQHLTRLPISRVVITRRRSDAYKPQAKYKEREAKSSGHEQNENSIGPFLQEGSAAE